MSDTNRRYQAAIEHDDKVAEHTRLMDVLKWSKTRADEAVWGVYTEARKAELAAQRQAELDRSGEWAAITNAVANDYNELTRDDYKAREDIAAERRRRDMGGY
jgi:hypothetical protein